MKQWLAILVMVLSTVAFGLMWLPLGVLAAAVWVFCVYSGLKQMERDRG